MAKIGELKLCDKKFHKLQNFPQKGHIIQWILIFKKKKSMDIYPSRSTQNKTRIKPKLKPCPSVDFFVRILHGSKVNETFSFFGKYWSISIFLFSQANTTLFKSLSHLQFFLLSLICNFPRSPSLALSLIWDLSFVSLKFV